MKRDEKEKRALAMNLNPGDFKDQPIFRFCAGLVKIELCYEGKNFVGVQVFLREYFRNFPTFEGEPDISVHYQCPEGKYGDAHWEMWNHWTHEIEVIHEAQADVILQRDFVGKMLLEGKHFYAIGPEWSRGVCDPLDNIVSYVLGKKLILYHGVILHAASVAYNNEAYVFFGASGAGKSTLAEHCYRVNHFSVISSDQVLIQYREGQLHAQLMPTTIPEFPLEHPGRESRALPVRCLIHLMQKKGEEYQFRPLESVEWLKIFMRELVYRSEFAEGERVLDLSLKIAQDSAIIKGEMSYQKGTDFFSRLLQEDFFHENN